jgi:xanthine/uracil/vitamin C permease (AzgA family)
MQHPAVFAFGAIFLILTAAGLLLVVSASQSRPLPQYSPYTDSTSFINKTAGMVPGFTVGVVGVMVPLVLLLILLFVVAVLVFVFGRRRG